MRVFLNKEELNFDEQLNLIELLSHQNIKTEGIAVAINNRIVTRDLWPSTNIENEDKITVIQATYGG